MIDSGASYHMTPHREWFSEYEKYNGGDVFLGDDSTKKILEHGRVKLLLKDGRIRTLPQVMHIPKLARSLIYVSKMDDARMDTVFGKNTCKMVRGVMVLMR
jgi:ribosomal protein L30E